MLNYETLLSSYDDKLTLLQWLKKVEEALKNASAVSFKVNKRGDATLTFSVVFEDGSELETSPIILQQGESVQAAAIRNGHLILTLTNGDELDAGNLGAVSGFSINEAQHLIVAYQNGTTQDLGAIFTGDVTLTGTLAAAAVKTASLTSDEDEISAQKPVVEVMNGYYFEDAPVAGLTKNVKYVGAVKNGNKLTLSYFASFNRSESLASGVQLGYFDIPQNVANALIPETFSGLNMLSLQQISAFQYLTNSVQVNAVFAKHPAVTNRITLLLYNADNLNENTDYLARVEVTFLLSSSLIA